LAAIEPTKRGTDLRPRRRTLFIARKHLSRRTVLKGAGVALALPFLDAMVPAATPLAQTAAAPKLRTGFFYIPHGAVQGDTILGPAGDRWTPSGSGADFKLNAITQPLEPFKKYVSTIGNLDNASAVGRHVKNAGTWLNCSDPPTTTVDQILVRKFGLDTMAPSLEVASETTVQQAAGNGVNTSVSLSFRDADTPLPMEYNPRKIYIRLFGDGNPQSRIAESLETNSLLDLIKDGTQKLQVELGAGDKAVLENYLENVRRIERQTQAREAAARDLQTRLRAANTEIPEMPRGVSDEFDKQVGLIFDLLAIAFMGDITRVASYYMVAEGSNQTYNHIGVPDSFHPISHHANDPDRIEKLVKIQTWHMAKFAEFLKKMAATPDGDGTLLDHAVFLYGSNMGNSDKHSNWPLPTVLVGGGNGRMKLGGQHIALPEPTPLANVHLTLLNKAGIEQARFADSTGIVSGI
jgi:hypothetical protein